MKREKKRFIPTALSICLIINNNIANNSDYEGLQPSEPIDQQENQNPDKDSNKNELAHKQDLFHNNKSSIKNQGHSSKRITTNSTTSTSTNQQSIDLSNGPSQSDTPNDAKENSPSSTNTNNIESSAQNDFDQEINLPTSTDQKTSTKTTTRLQKAAEKGFFDLLLDFFGMGKLDDAKSSYYSKAKAGKEITPDAMLKIIKPLSAEEKETVLNEWVEGFSNIYMERYFPKAAEVRTMLDVLQQSLPKGENLVLVIQPKDGSTWTYSPLTEVAPLQDQSGASFKIVSDKQLAKMKAKNPENAYFQGSDAMEQQLKSVQHNLHGADLKSAKDIIKLDKNRIRNTDK